RALLHQQPDHVDRALGHPVGEFLDRDRFRDGHFANQLFLLLVRRMSLEALGAAAERRDRALAHVVGIERGDDRQPAALLLRRRLGRRLGSRGGAGNAAGAATDLARAFILVTGVGGNAGRPYRNRRARVGGCGLGFGFAKTLLGFEFGLALGFLVLAVTFLFGLATGLGGLAFGLLDAFLAVAAPSFLFRQPSFLDVPQLRVGQRAGTRRPLILGQRAKHDARIAPRRCRRRCRTG